MPSHLRSRPLKSWRYVGIFGPEVMLCAAIVRVGPVRQAFWAVWDRTAGELRERTVLGRGEVHLAPGSLRIREPSLVLDVRLAEELGIETVVVTDAGHAWTRKQAGVLATGTIALGGSPRRLEARAVIDDTAAYYPRHTQWRWCAGVGTTSDGRSAAWNLVAGVNDPPTGSERTVWIDGEPAEAPPCRFSPDLTGVDALRFHAEATRERNENRLILRSRYRQPFGTFSGRLPGGIELREGYGVMEAHDVHW